jgi:D-alanine-D-alanine ligase
MELEYHVVDTSRELGHQVQVVPFGPSVESTIQALREGAPDLVFNLTEHYGGDRRMDHNIVGLLELLGLPCTGTGTTGLILCRDKAICKRLLSHHRVRVPGFVLLAPGRTQTSRRLRFPVVVKPLYEDGSDGIALASLVQRPEELAERTAMVHERMKQPAICEEFIDGREIYVSILGNRRLEALPARECRFGDVGSASPKIATSRVKHDPGYCKKWHIEFTHAELDPALEARVARVSRQVYRLLLLRDYGRIDLRITPGGDIVFLEANPNPDLTMGDEVAEAAARAGLSYRKLIDRVLRAARRRYTRPRR